MVAKLVIEGCELELVELLVEVVSEGRALDERELEYLAVDDGTTVLV
jgi:hypothetical protein